MKISFNGILRTKDMVACCRDDNRDPAAYYAFCLKQRLHCVKVQISSEDAYQSKARAFYGEHSMLPFFGLSVKWVQKQQQEPDKEQQSTTQHIHSTIVLSCCPFLVKDENRRKPEVLTSISSVCILRRELDVHSGVMKKQPLLFFLRVLMGTLSFLFPPLTRLSCISSPSSPWANTRSHWSLF